MGCDILNEIQRGLLMMIRDFDEAMRLAGVDYFLTAGSAIGAIRHQGFIPWDDDMDVIILRKDVPDFLEAMNNLPTGKYYIQEPLSLDWPYLFYKIRLNGSTAIEAKYKDTRIHQGLFIDVFVAEDYPDSIIRRLAYDLLMYWIRVLQTVCDGRLGSEKFDFIQKTIRNAISVTSKIMDRLPEPDCHWVGPRMPWFKNLIRKKNLKDPIDCRFEDATLKISPEYDEMLRGIFGDYMAIPAEDQRPPGHIIAFDLNEDYRIWLEKNK